ncbi:uncharacterized protein [Watersipora subatra]|uniref:uncharacterized protein n=1 Tax=Watersipora subatra TaxID=2589382 RepID=UPI00355B4F27
MKCELLQSQVRYLSHIVSREEVVTDPAKVEVVEWWPTPCRVRELQGFLGTVEYYRRYIPGFATNAKPLHWLVGKEDPWQWMGKKQAAFDTLRHSLTTAPVLEYPDPGNTCILDMVASREKPSHQVAHWIEVLAEFKYMLEHHEWLKYGNADSLS